MTWLHTIWQRLPLRGKVATAGMAQKEQMLVSLLVMAWAVEARDPYTGGHLWRVSRYAALLSERAGLATQTCARIAVGGFLHDLGKISTPDAILRKQDKLEEQEYSVIKTHPQAGARMIAGHPLADMVRDAILLHHERPDGCGYPFGLAGSEVPLAARVVGLCDAFDAMTSTRSYRAGMPIDQALSEIARHRGGQFDETLARQLDELAREGLLEHIVGHSDDGIPLQACLSCGPTLVVRRESRARDTICCPACGSEYALQNDEASGSLRALATGRSGTAEQLTLEVDGELVRRFAADAARNIWQA